MKWILPPSVCIVLLFFSLNGFAQSLSVSSKVTGTNNEPLSCVTVQVKGGTATTVTATDDGFHLNVPAVDYQLFNADPNVWPSIVMDYNFAWLDPANNIFIA